MIPKTILEEEACRNGRMQIRMQNAEALTGQQIDEFLTASEGIGFTGESRAAIYAWTERLLVAQEFMGQSRKRRGAIRRYASKVTGLSLPQITRLIRSYAQSGTVELRISLRCRFPGKYTERDVTLLAEVDRAHERLSGPATQRILRRELEEYGKAEYARLAGISVCTSTTCGTAALPSAGGCIRAHTAECEFDRGAAPTGAAGPSGLPAG